MELAADRVLDDLRRRADEDFLEPSTEREPGRHRAEVPELGLQVSLTRARYPNRPDGRDLYVLTLSRPQVDRAPGGPEVERVLGYLFEGLPAEERPMGPLVRSFRIPATSSTA